jgi:hypothetical protein
METSFTLPLSSAPHWSMMAGIYKYKGPSEQAIKKYQEEAHPKWLPVNGSQFGDRGVPNPDFLFQDLDVLSRQQIHVPDVPDSEAAR